MCKSQLLNIKRAAIIKAAPFCFIPILFHRREVFRTEGFNLSPVVYVQAASVQTLYVQVARVLKGHGRKSQALMAQAV